MALYSGTGQPRARCDANAVIANLIHPLVYAPGANMPQDFLTAFQLGKKMVPKFHYAQKTLIPLE